MRKSVSGMAALTAVGVLLGAASAPAQDQSLSGSAREARIAELTLEATLGRDVDLPANAAALDEALARRDYGSLRSQMGADDEAESWQMLNWTKVAVFKGAPFWASIIYAGDLWRMGEAYERAAVREPTNAATLNERARSLKMLSTYMGLHAVTQIQVDGARCVDPAAYTGMLAESQGALEPQWAFARSLPVEDRARIIRGASALEAKVAPVREPDYRLCASGTADMRAMAGGTPRPVVDLATPGADVAVDVDPDDLIVDNEQWWATMQVARMLAVTTAARALEVPLAQVM
jgi:hypothetical protein